MALDNVVNVELPAHHLTEQLRDSIFRKIDVCDGERDLDDSLAHPLQGLFVMKYETAMVPKQLTGLPAISHVWISDALPDRDVPCCFGESRTRFQVVRDCKEIAVMIWIEDVDH